MSSICNMNQAFKAMKECKPSMAGTGDRAYIYDKDAWLERISAEAGKEGSVIKTKTLPEPGFGGIYGALPNVEFDPADESTWDKEVMAKMALLEGFLFGVDIKADSGHVTSESSETTDANSQSIEFVVDGNIKAWNQLAVTLKQINFGVIAPDVNGGMYVIMSQTKKTTLNNAYDSGTTWDSDHGFTANCSAAPSLHAVSWWYPTDDLRQWCADKASNVEETAGSLGD